MTAKPAIENKGRNSKIFGNVFGCYDLGGFVQASQLDRSFTQIVRYIMRIYIYYVILWVYIYTHAVYASWYVHGFVLWRMDLRNITRIESVDGLGIYTAGHLPSLPEDFQKRRRRYTKTWQRKKMTSILNNLRTSSTSQHLAFMQAFSHLARPVLVHASLDSGGFAFLEFGCKPIPGRGTWRGSD